MKQSKTFAHDLRVIAVLVISVFTVAACAKDSSSPEAVTKVEKEIGDLPDDNKDPDAPGEPTRGEYIRSLTWAIPEYSKEEERELLKAYAHIDPKRMIPTNLLVKTLLYFHRNQQFIENQRYISIFDLSKSSKVPRYFLVDMASGEVKRIHVAYGRKSDVNNDGIADKFGNTYGSLRTSLGFYLTWETYSGGNGYSLRIDGLSSTNSRARERAIVVHGADYVKDKNVKQGRSLGCPAFSMSNRTMVIDAIRGGSLMYLGRSKID